MSSTDAISCSSHRFRQFDNPRTLALSRIIRYYIPMARVISLKTPKNTDELKELYKQNQLVYNTPIEELINSSSHALGAVFALIFMIFMMIAAKSPAQYVTAFFSCFLIAIEFLVSATYHGVSDMKKKLVWRKIDFPAVNLNHCLRNVHVPFISPNIRLRRARSVDCHRNRRLCALPLEIQRLPQRVRHLVFRHRRAYACGILHGVLLSDRHIRAHLLRVSCRACVLPSRRGSIRRAQKIRALPLPLLRACRSGAVFGGNLSSNHWQINTSSLVNK